MPIIKCKMCGGDIQLAEDKTFGTCEYCGSVMTLPRVSDEQRAAAFNRGNHFRRAGEFDKALGVYEHIVADDDTDAEAHWCCALCRFGIEYVEDPATYEWLPTCHRASFDSFLEDVDYLAALEHSDGITRRQYQKDAAKIAEVQRGILAASQNTEPYDVFISYKELDENGERTRDSILAQEIYYRLTEKGWRVFFSRISLEDVPGTQYEPYIFAALNSAKVMVVVGTSAENLNAVWVKNEWSRFLAMMRKDRSKLLIPCYRDMDPYDLPEQLSVLMSYDMGRIGFIQDLIRGVDKVLSAEKKEETVRETVKETVVVQQNGDSAARITAAMDRGFMALEDGEWNKAVSFFDQVLSLDAKNARAYYGMALAKAQCKDASAYIEKLCAFTPKSETIELPVDEEHIREAAEKYAVSGYLSDAEITALYQYRPGYSPTEKSQRQLIAKARSNYENDRNLIRARKFAAGETKTELDKLQIKLFERLDNSIKQAARNDRAAKEQAEKDYLRFLESKDKLAEEKKRDAEAKREQDYQFALHRFKQANSIEAYQNAKPLFLKLSSYKDSAEMAKRCEEETARIEREVLEEAEQKRKAEAERQRISKERAERERTVKKKHLTLVAVLTIITAVAAYFTYTKIIVPANIYKTAETLYQEEKYYEAIAVFASLGGYRDSAARIEEIKEAINAQDYANAEALFKDGKYEEAIEAFTDLGDYKDSAAKIIESKEEILARDYAKAKSLFAAGEYMKAVAAFQALNGYKDSNDIIRDVQKASYVAADELFREGEYGKAAIAFGVAENYKDARERSASLWKHFVRKKTISAGSFHIVGLNADGTVVSRGYNNAGQCEVSGWTDIVEIAAGCFHTVGLKADKTVIAIGQDDEGQCEVDEWTDIIAIAAGRKHTVGLKSDGTVVAVGWNEFGQCDVSGWTDIVAISASYDYTVGLKKNGTVVAVGSNGNGQCDISGWTNIVAIEAGVLHTVGLKSDGSVIAVGGNKFGQCETANWTDITAIAAGMWHTVGLKSDGTIIAIGSNEDGQCAVSNWRNITAIAADINHTVGLKNDGTVVVAGSNYYYQWMVKEWPDIKLPIVQE